MTLDHLKNIAARVKEIGGDGAGITLSVTNENRERDPGVVAALVAVGAQRVVTVWPGSFYHAAPYAIESARIAVDGVNFSAQHARAATPDEIATLPPEQRQGQFTEQLVPLVAS